MIRPTTISLADARRMVLAAQGFDAPRPRRVTVRHVAATIRRLGLVQLDFVTVVTPAHYQVLFSRLGPFSRRVFDDVVYRRRLFTEHWAHEASVVPVETWPLLEYRRATHRARPWHFEKFLAKHPEYVAAVLDTVRERGPVAADELDGDHDAATWLAHSWFRSVPRAVLEAHFGRGRLAVAGRRDDFARRYDLTERLIPAVHRERRVDHAGAQRELLASAAHACGVATAADLADYFRMSAREAAPRIAELVESGDLGPVAVEGWRATAYLHRDARAPRRAIAAGALISPFDPLVWFRPRTARLFGFDYRFEIFVPAAKRRWGTYVLPFLLGERLVARVDLRADRATRRLRVLGAYLEPRAQTRPVARALAAELSTLATWLDLDRVTVGRRGDLAGVLRAEMGSDPISS